jgi:hypothetical protein
MESSVIPADPTVSWESLSEKFALRWMTTLSVPVAPGASPLMVSLLRSKLPTSPTVSVSSPELSAIVSEFVGAVIFACSMVAVPAL